jgi:hypothetical protein
MIFSVEARHAVRYYSGHTTWGTSAIVTRLFLRADIRGILTRVSIDRNTSIWSPPLNFLVALTLGAGVQWGAAYEAARANNRFVIGGLSLEGSVGAAGGWILGGGHSVLSARHGLGKYTMSIAAHSSHPLGRCGQRSPVHRCNRRRPASHSQLV